MSVQMLVAMGLALAVLLAALRIGLRRPLLLALQCAAAALLYFTLFPPAIKRDAGVLVIATAGTTPAMLATHGSGATVLALPESPMLVDVARVPDLATALRRHPADASLRIVGAGLGPRDIAAARGRAVVFAAVALPRGFVDISAPAQVTVGTMWTASGRVNGVPAGSIELVDPAGAIAAQTRADGRGSFSLAALSPVSGRMRYQLRVRDAKATLVESLALPLQAVPGSQPRVLMLAGGPGPELKYLRRWAMDAGVQLRTQVSLGGGLQLGDAPIAFNAATLQGLDLVVLDERAWRDLGDARRGMLREAMANGLGVLLRITGPVSVADRAQLRGLGFTVSADTGPTTVVIVTGIDGLPALARQPLRVASDDAQSLLRDAAGEPLALWRNVGRGRLGLWWLGDSFRLVTSGHASLHGRAWSDAFTTLARATASATPTLASDDPRVQQRLVLCGLQPDAAVIDPAGNSTRLSVDPATSTRRCAAYWPTSPGWHRVRSGDAAIAWVVRDVDEAPGVRARMLREQTLRLVSRQGATAQATKATSAGPRWPWFVAWLLASALGWWLERRWLRPAAIAGHASGPATRPVEGGTAERRLQRRNDFA